MEPEISTWEFVYFTVAVYTHRFSLKNAFSEEKFLTTEGFRQWKSHFCVLSYLKIGLANFLVLTVYINLYVDLLQQNGEPGTMASSSLLKPHAEPVNRRAVLSAEFCV